MQSKLIAAIYRKEILDVVRDRRTMISMVLVPLVSMPLLFIVMSRFVSSAGKSADDEALPVAVRSEDRLPGLLNALAGARFKLVESNDFRGAIERKEIVAAVEPVQVSGSSIEIRVYADLSRRGSQLAATRIRTALDAFKENTVRLKLISLGMPESVMTPFQVKSVNVAPDAKMAASFWGTILGYTVVIFMFSSAMYPAIDMTAGEKERRTLEILLSAPAGRHDVILGKLLAATTSVAITAVLSIASLLVSFRLFNVGDAGFVKMTGHMPFTVMNVAMILVVLLPLSVMSASLMIAIALFAKSFKEAQSYLTPLVMFSMFPLTVGFGSLQLTPALAMIPLFNVCQTIKEILLGDVSMAAFGVTLASNLAYAAFAFLAAIRIFDDERVLFRS